MQNILPLQYGRSALRLTVARNYRPNGQNIHRATDATEEAQWRVRPDEGLEVELDEDSLEKLAKRWREASYPSLAGIDDRSSDQAEDTPDGGDSGLTIDPQLRRAVEYLREKLSSDIPVTAAA